MIATNLEEPTTLQRVLLNLEDRLPLVETPVSTLSTATEYTDETRDKKINEIIDTINAISVILNNTQRKSI